MENVKDKFKLFLQRVILPNLKKNIREDEKIIIYNSIDILEQEYNNYFKTSLFDIDILNKEDTIKKIKNNLQQKENPIFENYNSETGYDISKKLLTTHLINFIKYYDEIITFKTFQDFVDKVHEELGNKFILKFQHTRIKYNKKTRVGSRTKLFGNVRGDYWTINVGAEKEIQFHMFFDGKKVGYGIAFNAQASMNNRNPIDKVLPFVNSYFQNQDNINSILNDYKWIVNDEKLLNNIGVGDFICLGKTVPIEKSKNLYNVDGLSLLEIIYDLKNKQFQVYNLIFKKRNTQLNSDKEMNKFITLLKSNKNIIFIGAPGTGKTYLAKQIAENIINGNKPFEEDKIRDYLIKGETLFTKENYTFEIVGLTDNVIKLQPKDAGNKRTISYERIQKCINEKTYNGSTNDVDEASYIFSLAKHILEKRANKYNDFVQFHPSYDYTDFVEGLRPIKKDNKELGFELKNGTFKAFCKKAKDDPDNDYVFIIDEINRAEISKVFGELFYSIEPDYRGIKGKVKTQYENIQEGDTIFDKKLGRGWFYIPENVYIIGTMNDIDRSVESFDFAMRRRFAWKEITAKESINMLDSLKEILPDNKFDWIDLAKNKLKRINKVIWDDNSKPSETNVEKKGIEGLNSAYHIGASYFLKLKNYKKETTDIAFEMLWNNHIKGLLQEYLRGMQDAESSLKVLKNAYNLSE